MNKQIIFRNLQWSVSHQGDLICLEKNFEIDHETLLVTDWIEVMKPFEWCNDFFFKQAYEHAVKNVS